MRARGAGPRRGERTTTKRAIAAGDGGERAQRIPRPQLPAVPGRGGQGDAGRGDAHQVGAGEVVHQRSEQEDGSHGRQRGEGGLVERAGRADEHRRAPRHGGAAERGGEAGEFGGDLGGIDAGVEHHAAPRADTVGHRPDRVWLGERGGDRAAGRDPAEVEPRGQTLHERRRHPVPREVDALGVREQRGARGVGAGPHDQPVLVRQGGGVTGGGSEDAAAAGQACCHAPEYP